MLPCPMIQVKVKLQLNPVRMAKGTDHSGMKVWLILPPGIEERPAEVLAEGGENTVELRKVVITISQGHVTSYRKNNYC